MASMRLLRARLQDTDGGMAMILVVGIGMVLTLLVTMSLTYSLGGMIKANKDQDWTSAMAAAYAGIEEYQSRLADDNTYQQYGNAASPFSTGSVFTATTNVNPAFGLGTTGTWASVPGGSGEASFRYEVDNSKYGSTGVLRIRSTGRVGTQTRSVVANLKQQGFIDFLYFTDYEIQDPDISGVSSSCVKYDWAARASNCGEIQFGSSDVINGPLHSNDTLLICGANFKGPVTTSTTVTSKYQNACSPTVPTFLPGYPRYAPVVGMPSTNSAMKQEVRSDLSITVPRPGCLYTGPTSIVFNANGTMNVRSPWTKLTNVAGSPATTGTAPAACGVIADLNAAAGATITVPANNLIYVQNVPSISGDPNYWAANAYPSVSATGISCSGTSTITCTGAATSSGSGNGIGYPTALETSPGSKSYGYRNGDAFVKGDVHGAVTVAAENYVYVTGDIKYTDSSSDILGIVGNNAIWVWNPVTSTGTTILANSGRRIDAALLSVAHTFGVQNYASGGNRGTLTVNGAIAQKFRGPVGTTANTGYAKNYVYDPRLRYVAPPKFLSPVSTSYGVSVLIEVKTAFSSTGSAIP